MEEREPLRKRAEAWKKYIGWGLTAFCVISLSVLLIFILNQSDSITNPFGSLKTALAPVFIGGILAYIVNPLMRVIERRVRLIMLKHEKPDKTQKARDKSRRAARYISITISMIIVLLVVGFLVYLLVPQLTQTIAGLAKELPGQIQQFLTWFNSIPFDDSELGVLLHSAVTKATISIETFVETKFTDMASDLLSSLATGIWSALGTLYNVVIGFIFALYILSSKETLGAQIKKILHAFLKEGKTEKFLRIVHMCHDKFTGAIIGKILDSIIVGILCFIGMAIFRFPYPALISVIVGVTNVIPFFGPYFGAVPSALLVLFVDPMKALWFIVFVIVLQQIDCNIIDPRIVGNSIGLSAFWVLFACVVFGSLFGILGLLMGVPLMACAYMLIKEAIESRLRTKGEPIDTDEYK